MSNVNIDTEQINYSEGEAMMRELYNERNVIQHTWDDFLKLPKQSGYSNNQSRVPNDFKLNVIDKQNTPYTTLTDVSLPVDVNK